MLRGRRMARRDRGAAHATATGSGSDARAVGRRSVNVAPGRRCPPGRDRRPSARRAPDRSPSPIRSRPDRRCRGRGESARRCSPAPRDAPRDPVADADPDGRLTVEHDPHLAALGAGADGVVEQDPQNLGDAARIPHRPHRAAEIIETGPDVVLLVAELELGEDRPAELAQLDRPRSAAPPGRRSGRDRADRRRDARGAAMSVRPAPPGPGHPPGRDGRRSDRRAAARACRRVMSTGCGARATRWPQRRAGLLLLAKPVLHDGQRPGQVPHLVVDAVVGTTAVGPAWASSSAASRNRRSRRTSRADSGMPRIRLSARPARAASRNARRTARTAPGISPIGLRTAST